MSMATLSKGEKEKKPSDVLLDLYSDLLTEIWEVVSALIGESILELLFILAVRKIAEKYRFLTLLKVSDEGISLEGAREDCGKMAPAEVHRGFQNLITHLFDLFSALAGGVISRELFPKVFPRVKEAERVISQK